MNQSQLLKPYVEFYTHTHTHTHTHASKNGKNGDKDRKSVIKINEKSYIWKKMKNLRNRIDVKLVSNKKDYLKRTSKTSYILHKIFDNDLVAIRKKGYTWQTSICWNVILELAKVLLYQFHYDYIKNKYGSN